MLCLPADIPASIQKIKQAVKDKRLIWDNIYTKVKRVLMAKYQYVLPNVQPINTTDITHALNDNIPALRRTVADNAITLVRNNDQAVFPTTSESTQENRLCGNRD